MAHDPTRVADTRAWLGKGEMDLRAARNGFEATPPLLEDVLFHCQQAVEKVLKGFLTWHDRPFRKTHDLAVTGQQCVELDNSLEALCCRAGGLTVYAWFFRYPGESEQPSEEEARHALALAQEVNDAIRDRLPENVCP